MTSRRPGNLERFGIDIQVDKGTLWLKGELASEEHRHTVLEIARRISGVKQVVNELSIKKQAVIVEPSLASQPEESVAPATSRRPSEVEPIVTEAIAAKNRSQEITDEVLRRLATQKELGALREFGIDVQVDNQVVWMSGYVANEQQRTLALDMARRVSGVKQVVNDLSVTKTSEDATVRLVAHPVPADPSVPVEPQELQPLRPSLAEQTAPQADSAQQAQAPSQLPSGISYMPTSQNSQIAGWALVNVGGNQSQLQQVQMQPAASIDQQPVTDADGICSSSTGELHADAVRWPTGSDDGWSRRWCCASSLRSSTACRVMLGRVTLPIQTMVQ